MRHEIILTCPKCGGKAMLMDGVRHDMHIIPGDTITCTCICGNVVVELLVRDPRSLSRRFAHFIVRVHGTRASRFIYRNLRRRMRRK